MAMFVPVDHVQNRLLATLPETDLQTLGQHMQTVSLVQQSALYERGDRLTQAYFPHGGAICKGLADAAGHTVVTAIVGSDGMIGAFAVLDGLKEDGRAFVRVQGTASTIGTDALRGISLENQAVRSML